jgi:hypothetical protein
LTVWSYISDDLALTGFGDREITVGAHDPAAGRGPVVHPTATIR